MTITNKFSTVHTTAKLGRLIEYIVIHYTAGVKKTYPDAFIKTV